jgi:hypothetical protein
MTFSVLNLTALLPWPVAVKPATSDFAETIFPSPMLASKLSATLGGDNV